MDKNSSPILPLKELCRTCTASSSDANKISVKCIYEPLLDESGSPSIMDVLIALEPQIEIGFLDELPKIVCMTCIQQLQKTYKFLVAYRHANEKLQKLLKDVKSTTKETVQKVSQQQQQMQNFVDDDIDSLLPVDYEIDIIEKHVEEEDNVEVEDVDIKWTDNDAYNSESHDGEDEDHGPGYVGIKWVDNDAKISESSLDESNDLLKDMAPLPNRTTSCEKEQIKSAIEQKPDSDEKEPRKNKDGTYNCPECEMVLDSVPKWRQHVQTEHKHVKIKKQGKSYKCEFCGKVFYHATAYRNHTRTHTGEEPYLCVECGKSFKVRSSLYTHMLRHKGEKNMQCPQCPKQFVCASGLYCHMLVHKKEKPFVCDTCGAAFHMAYMLRKHNLYHRGVKPHPCEHCDLRFVTAEKLRRHVRTHTGEKPYVCHYCDRAFAQSNDCNKHMKQHVGENIYQCELCPLRFPLVRDLRVHFATHRNDDEETRKRNLEARKIEVHNLRIKFGYKKKD
ncbi:zinc finger protein 625 isoform X1 [Musca domestica]|uniref:Zinc finger protein 625 isoform X1 n=1 Tax=Musca domestica TaxID=7370 RepID=A0A9J7CV63_MUSDO|nr:zinc finger protein 625 isoform X1 [Musca domestica]